MFPQMASFADPFGHNPKSAPRKDTLWRTAVNAYEKKYARGRLGRALPFLHRKPAYLKDLQEAASQDRISRRHYAGIRHVAIDKIRGSESRSSDFDADFNPLNRANRRRWLQVAMAQLEEIPLPAVKLIQLGDDYFVRDGHHRIATAKALGQEYLDAEVILWDIEDFAEGRF